MHNFFFFFFLAFRKKRRSQRIERYTIKKNRETLASKRNKLRDSSSEEEFTAYSFNDKLHDSKQEDELSYEILDYLESDELGNEVVLLYFIYLHISSVLAFYLLYKCCFLGIGL